MEKQGTVCVRNETDIKETDGKEVFTVDDAIKLSNSNVVVLDLTEKGLPRDKRHNYDRVITQDSYLNQLFSYNLMDGRVYVTGAYWNLTPHFLNDVDESKVQGYISELYALDNEKRITQSILSVAFQRKFHPIREMLDSIRGTWDGKERLKELFPKYLGAKQCDYTTAVTKLLFFGAIQRVMHPACKFDYCIVIKGEQGSGKSTLIRFIALDDLYFTDDLKNLADENVFECIRGKWIVEMGEMLFTKKTKEVEAIKSFLTRLSDSYRTRYTKHKVDYPRQCIFIGTTNSSDFLPDDKTGNRRFVPLLCEGKAEIHPLDNESETREYIRQCYAEAMVLGEAEGYPLVLDKVYAEQAAEYCEFSTPEDYRVGMIQEWLDGTDEKYVCSRMIWEEVFNRDGKLSQPQRYELHDISAIMNNQIDGWERYPTKNQTIRFKNNKNKKYGSQRAWQRVNKEGEFVNADDFDGDIPF